MRIGIISFILIVGILLSLIVSMFLLIIEQSEELSN